MKVKCIRGCKKRNGDILLVKDATYEVAMVVMAGYKPEKGKEGVESGYQLKNLAKGSHNVWDKDRFEVINN